MGKWFVRTGIGLVTVVGAGIAYALGWSPGWLPF